MEALDQRKLAREYAEKICSPDRWVSSARELLKAAALLEPSIREWWARWSNLEVGDPAPRIIDLNTVRLMLFAYALENILKAGIAKRFAKSLQSEARAKRRLPKRLKSHDLIALAEPLGIKLSEHEEWLLHRLARNSTWAGRYPLPESVAKWNDLQMLSDGSERLTSSVTSWDAEEVHTLVRRLADELGFVEQLRWPAEP